MKTIEIYCNYGVLAEEKRNVYTFGAEHPHATCSDKMTVVVPDGWELYQNQMGRTMVTAPWGWDYDINEVLTDINGRAAFRALDKNMRHKTACNRIISGRMQRKGDPILKKFKKNQQTQRRRNC